MPTSSGLTIMKRKMRTPPDAMMMPGTMNERPQSSLT
jgi:hypothetical protein